MSHTHTPHSTHPKTKTKIKTKTNTVQLLQNALDELVQILQQPGPPSLRELLEAYSQKGNGDRELLLAMLNAKSSEDQVSRLESLPLPLPFAPDHLLILAISTQRVAAVIQSHQTLIQAHAVAQSQMQQQQQQQLQIHHQQATQHTHRLNHLPMTTYSNNNNTGHGHLLPSSSQVIAPPSPSGTSQSQSSTSSPRLQTILPPIHSHLAELRTLSAGPSTKRRRTERDGMMMIDSIASSARGSGSKSGGEIGRYSSSVEGHSIPMALPMALRMSESKSTGSLTTLRTSEARMPRSESPSSS
jgi:hypothetical protein